MSRATIYHANENGPYTYDFDESLPPLPLPDLRSTLQRYYETLKPFGTAAELENSRAIIKDFELGIGDHLQKKLKERASTSKNWLEEWWDKYAYHSLKTPLHPYTIMAAPLRLDVVGLTETKETALINIARVTYHTIEFWDMMRKCKIRPVSDRNDVVKYSSALYKRFFSTSRLPGLDYDRVVSHFKTVDQGPTPSHGLITAKGRIFTINLLQEDGNIITAPQILVLLQRLRSILDNESLGDCVASLTHDERNSWAKNHQQLKEISEQNKETLNIIETSAVVVVLDENEPKNYEEVSQLSLYGDYHSRWGDRSSIVVAYKNGKIACVGEHSAYDGTISVSYMLFVQLSLFEYPEPNWQEAEQSTLLPFKELTFTLNDSLKNEIQRLKEEHIKRGHDVIVVYDVFNEFGKDFLKSHKLHPDSFIQVLLQWTYVLLHNEIKPIYETALMRQYYNGRTETLRSCTNDVYKFLKLANSKDVSKNELIKTFRAAVNDHLHMMNEARKGNGIDRHLFGLWCVAYENGINIPKIYEDPLYAKSGGGGNFVLSTSTLGYSNNLGFVAPMLLDGYGIFYSITSEAVFMQVTVFRDSQKTSGRRFVETFRKTYADMKLLLENFKSSNL